MAIDPRNDDSSFEHVVAAIDGADLSDEGKQQMYRDRRFGIDSGTGLQTSAEASDDEDWEVSMNTMRDLCRDGGLVFLPATNTSGVEGGLIGQVPSGADIEPKDYQGGEDKVMMKTLKLRHVREVHPDDDTELFDKANWGRYTVHSLNTHPDKVVAAYEELY